MPSYSFLTTWLLDAPRERVWDVIEDAEAWPQWWPGVLEVTELRQGDRLKVGSVQRQVWKSRLPYRVEFQSETLRVERPHLIEGKADGELRGHGIWRLFEADGGVTIVTYQWNVETTRAWMNLFAPFMRRAFESNHDWVMRGGGTGIAERLGCRLLASN